MAFVKGQKRYPGAGIKKGQKQEKTLLFAGLTEDNKREILEAAMKLVRKGNYPVINKLLDKILANVATTVELNMNGLSTFIKDLLNDNIEAPNTTQYVLNHNSGQTEQD
ncbi:MAG: hypothetical protein WC974_09110 [Thermoplasmata archaeon]